MCGAGAEVVHTPIFLLTPCFPTFPPLLSTFCTSGRRCSRSPLGCQLATTLVAIIFTVIFFPFFSYSPLSPFLLEGVLRSKTLFSES